MIKAIFLDLDGTLLTSDKKITSNSQYTLNKCKSKGIKVFTATARPPLLFESLDIQKCDVDLFNDGGIYYDGACIISNGKKEYLTINHSKVMNLIEFLTKKEHLNIVVQMTNELHSFKHNLDDHLYKLWGVNKGDCYPFTNLNNTTEEFLKILVLLKKPSIKFYKELIDSFSDFFNIYPSDNYTMIQIIHKKANKKFGIMQLLNKININDKYVAVIGDDLNDIEMLKHFNYSIAMGNASEKVKSNAKFITLTNDQDGVSYALKSLLYLI